MASHHPSNVIPFGPRLVDGAAAKTPPRVAAPHYLEPRLCSECGAELEADSTACLDEYCPLPLQSVTPDYDSFIRGIESAVIVTGFAILGIGAALMVFA